MGKRGEEEKGHCIHAAPISARKKRAAIRPPFSVRV